MVRCKVYCLETRSSHLWCRLPCFILAWFLAFPAYRIFAFDHQFFLLRHQVSLPQCPYASGYVLTPNSRCFLCKHCKSDYVNVILAQIGVDLNDQSLGKNSPSTNAVQLPFISIVFTHNSQYIQHGIMAVVQVKDIRFRQQWHDCTEDYRQEFHFTPIHILVQS